MNSEFFNQIINAQGALKIENLANGAEAMVVARALAKNNNLGVYIATDDAQAQKFSDAIGFFAPKTQILRLPSWDCLPYDRVGPAQEISARRLATLARLANGNLHNTILVTTASAIMQMTLPKSAIANSSFYAKTNDEIDIDALQKYLMANGYQRTDTVREKGEYAFRGALVDLYPPQMHLPVRLDMFGDNLESIRTFDPETQRSVDKLETIELVPVSEIMFDEANISRFRKSYLEKFGASQGDPIYQAVSERIRRSGIEHYISMFYEKLDSVFDYINDEAIIFVEHGVENSILERQKLIDDYYEARLAPVPKGSIPYKVIKPDALYLNPNKINKILDNFKTRYFSPFLSGEGGARLNAEVRIGRNFAPERQDTSINVWQELAKYTKELLANNISPIICAWSEGSAERLGHVLEEHEINNLFPVPNYGAISLIPKGRVGLCVLQLEHGFEYEKTAIISETDILGERLGRGKKRRKKSNFLMEASNLSSGDLIVHTDHGIGRYEGLRTLDVMGAPHDCLELIYQGGDKLFLPVENIELITRYGADGAEAILDKLGGVAWQGRKARAKKRLLEMAAGLIKIAAQRANQHVEEIVPPAGYYDEFCAKFPYDETDDQIHSIEDILEDLANGKPMDRLICGDVGFGKTEVALRAAFVVAMSGRQVAVVCPTTLLARQHFRTFSERFNGWPVRVRQLSRMVGSKEASETRKGIADGRIEIVVGTHALLSSQVGFNDLGLVIVDEEQHFGVKHKERLKEMRSDTHFLTLTATPIPRTLQMSLSGIREMSIIATPPVDRLAVRTYVTPWDSVTIREAILREKYRGGQSFVVAPRIEHLDKIRDYLRDYIPECSFAIAHGQMSPTELEPIVNGFYDGKYDILVSTTIVESGIDVPRANTLVVWRSDMLGLAQAYQLRGRVGRSKSRAYAYLTIPEDMMITPQATKRLKILQSLDSLGAGFQLASHDLDMRGGGNLLGEEQSGNIKEVGVELYQQMLEEAVIEIKDGQEALSNKSWSPSISIGLAVLIPEDYVSDLNLRLSLYRRLSELETEDERDGFATELVDRFGTMPLEVHQLIEVQGLKALCKKAGVEKLGITPSGAVITFKQELAPDPMKLITLMQSAPAIYRLRPDGKFMIAGNWQNDKQKLAGARNAINNIIKACF